MNRTPGSFTALSTNSPTTDRVLMTRVGLEIPPDADYGVWERAGAQLASLADAYTWCLGDWLNFGKVQFPDRYAQAIRAVGLKYQTLRNYAWVARRFDSTRRRSALTFQHHAEVASLTADEQDYWLEQAEQESWPSKTLRLRLQSSRDASIDRGSLPELATRIAIPDDRVDYWRRAADKCGVGLHEWVVSSLDEVAGAALDVDGGSTRALDRPR